MASLSPAAAAPWTARPHSIAAPHLPVTRLLKQHGPRESSAFWPGSASVLACLSALQVMRHRDTVRTRCNAQRRRRQAPSSAPAAPESTAPAPVRPRRQRRKALDPLQKVKQQKQDSLDPLAADPIQNLLEGEDPEFFGFPFLWVQNAHLLLFVVAVGAALTGDVDDFILFGLPPLVEDAVKPGLAAVIIINFLVAANMAREELVEGKGGFSALGWFLKGVFIGGVANWQRIGRQRYWQSQGKSEVA